MGLTLNSYSRCMVVVICVLQQEPSLSIVSVSSLGGGVSLPLVTVHLPTENIISTINDATGAVRCSRAASSELA